VPRVEREVLQAEREVLRVEREVLQVEREVLQAVGQRAARRPAAGSAPALPAEESVRV